MAFLRFSHLWACLALSVCLQGGDSVVFIHFSSTPPVRTRFTNAIFKYSLLDNDGGNPCPKIGCSMNCKLDGQPLKSCPAGRLTLNNLTANQYHDLHLEVATSVGETNSTFYKWFIDTIAPTASLSSAATFTNAENVSIDITFTEACTGGGGFKCVNVSTCPVRVNGPASIDASTFQAVEPDHKYRLVVALSKSIQYGRVVVELADSFCSDQAGNLFSRSKFSYFIVRFDRRLVLGSLWTVVPNYKLEINGIPRTVLATNQMDDLKFFLDFSDPIVNTTEDVLKMLQTTAGLLTPIHCKSHGNRRFGFQLKNVSTTEIITIRVQSSLLIGRTGAAVSYVLPLIFLYDSKRPEVKLSASLEKAGEAFGNVMVEFTKPVFGFDSTGIRVGGGKLTRFEEISKALYLLTILAEPGNAVTIHIPEGKANDISGNTNLVSNYLKVMSGFLATSLSATALALASANLAATGALTEEPAGADPSRNLLGMTGHLQVFAFSSWLSTESSLEYFETAKGLRWLIPHARFPWKREDASVAVYCQYSYGGADSFPIKYGNWHPKQHLSDREIDSYVGIRSINNSLPLNSTEYFTYFLRREPLFAANGISNIDNYTGWQDFQMNMFWLGTVGGSLILLHLFILFLLKWRTRSSAKGELSFPRFEIFLLISLLPCLCQSSAFVIRGGTTGGITVGALLLAVPVAFVLSICIFFTTAIFIGNFVQYKRIIIDNGKKVAWHSRLLDAIAGQHTIGKWCQRDRSPSTFLPRFGILFEDFKGPPTLVLVENNETGNVPNWVSTDHSGIGRMRVINSEDSNSDAPLPAIERISGSARSAYIVVDLVRRISLGIVFGAYPIEDSSCQSILAFGFTMLQFLYLFLLKPYINRGVQVVESISLLCEAGIFGLSLYNLQNHKLEDQKVIGIWMLVLFFVSFVGQLLNEWHALIMCLLRLPKSDSPSFGIGMWFVAKGLVIPFIPRKHWSKFVSRRFSEPKTCLVPVVQLSPRPELENLRSGPLNVDTASTTSATVVPLCLPDSPIPDGQLHLSTSLPEIAAAAHLGLFPTGISSSTKKKKMRRVDVKRPKGLKPASRNERKLRELAKASFPRGRTSGEVGPSYAAQDSFGSSDESEASSLIAQ